MLHTHTTTDALAHLLDALPAAHSARLRDEVRTWPEMHGALVRALDRARATGRTPEEVAHTVRDATRWGAHLSVRALWAIDALVRAPRL